MLAINGRVREGWHSVCQYGSIAALEQHTQLPPQVPHCLLLLLPRLTGQRCPQPLHLPVFRIFDSEMLKLYNAIF